MRHRAPLWHLEGGHRTSLCLFAGGEVEGELGGRIRLGLGSLLVAPPPPTAPMRDLDAGPLLHSATRVLRRGATCCLAICRASPPHPTLVTPQTASPGRQCQGNSSKGIQLTSFPLFCDLLIVSDVRPLHPHNALELFVKMAPLLPP